MKKSFLLVPVAIAVLTACINSTPAPVENVDGSLSPGVMEAVNSTTGDGSWEPQVQSGTMPADMNNPVVQQPVANQVQTQQPVQQIQQPVQQIQQPIQQTQQVQQTTPMPQQVSQNFEIPRNPTTNAPDYTKINKGFYKGETYTVRKGDTMFLIAYISGIDVKELATLNNMSEPYALKVGQTLKVSNGSTAAPVATTTTTVQTAAPAQPTAPSVSYTPAPNGTQYGSDGTITGPIKATAGGARPTTTAGAVTATTGTVAPVATGVTAGAGGVSATVNTTPPAQSNINWKWPTNGNVVQLFSTSDGGNKGIDISGSKGQAVYAAAPGRVVYAGNALRGYGNLIIIKHNDDFLSAYAHNDSISVKDQQEVSGGQQIAKMGSTGTNSVKLHFEIRYKGKSVDPMRYLPRR